MLVGVEDVVVEAVSEKTRWCPFFEVVGIRASDEKTSCGLDGRYCDGRTCRRDGDGA